LVKPGNAGGGLSAPGSAFSGRGVRGVFGIAVPPARLRGGDNLLPTAPAGAGRSTTAVPEDNMDAPLEARRKGAVQFVSRCFRDGDVFEPLAFGGAVEDEGGGAAGLESDNDAVVATTDVIEANRAVGVEDEGVTKWLWDAHEHGVLSGATVDWVRAAASGLGYMAK